MSIIIPCCHAQDTLVRAVHSVFGQTWRDWEAIIVSDDLQDYRPLLSRAGLEDERLRFVSTGLVRSGCHNARNAGFTAARGGFVTCLDADDVILPNRLDALVPLAQAHGAAADNLAVVADATGALFHQAVAGCSGQKWLTLAEFAGLNVPLVPVVRRDKASPRLSGVEIAEDFIANLGLIDRNGGLMLTPEASYIYRVRQGSIAHNEKSGQMFDAAYVNYAERLGTGDGFGLSAPARAIALEALKAKRALNQAFAAAQARKPGLDFQSFVRSRELAVTD